MTSLQTLVGSRVTPFKIPRQFPVSDLCLSEPLIYDPKSMGDGSVSIGTVPNYSISIGEDTIPNVEINPQLLTKTINTFTQLNSIYISGDEFKSLHVIGPKGRQYLDELLRTKEQLSRSRSGTPVKINSQLNFLNQPAQVVEKHVGKKRTPDFFELIYPLLLPPLKHGKPNKAILPYPLYSYQWVGVKKLVQNNSFLLADEMGTGKTVITCVAMRVLFQQGKIRNALIVAPVSVVRVWIDHLRDWLPEFRAVTIRGVPEERRIAWQTPANIYLVSFDTLRSDIENQNTGNKKSLQFDLVIVDEAQAIKNEANKRYRALKKIVSTYRWALTGTPLENKVDDTISIFNFIIPKYFPPNAAKTMTNHEITNKIAPYTLRRLKKDVMTDLPPKIRQVRWLELSDEQKKAYKAALYKEKEGIINLGNAITGQHIFSAINRLKHVCNFAPGAVSSPKSEAVIQILDEIENLDTKIIIYSQYVHDGGIEKIEQSIGQRSDTLTLTGDMPVAKREQVLDTFRGDPTKKILLASLGTGGVGVTLVEASYVVLFDQWWNPAKMRQAEDRVHRRGQKAASVNIYELWMADTIEERIYNLLSEKQRLASSVIDSIASLEDLKSRTSLEELLGVLDLKQNQDGSITEVGSQTVGAKKRIPRASQNEHLSVSEIQARFFDITPQAFERLVTAFIKRQGYPNAQHTGQSSDGGIDIRAWRNTGKGIERAYVQCKRHKNNVGAKEARDLFGVVSSLETNAIGILVSASDFTVQCKQFSSANTNGRIRLINGFELASKIWDYGIDIKQFME